MSAFGNYLEQKIIGATLLGSTYTSPTSLWIALCTSITSDGDSITEVTTNIAYARQLVTGKFSEPTSGGDWSSVNSEALTWSAATSAWGTVAHWTIVDTLTIGQGNVHYHHTMTTPRAILNGDIAEFLAGTLSITLD
jgi:hypothetical protein